jgi:hypothetical protein
LERDVPLTDTAIRETKRSKRRYKIYDRHGLFLLINPSVQSCGDGAMFSLRRAKSWVSALI